jgi:uncharacterized protein (UPF0276 family)
MSLWIPFFLNISKIGRFILYITINFHDASFLFHLNVLSSNETRTSFSLDVNNIMVNSQFYVGFQTLYLLVKINWLKSY